MAPKERLKRELEARAALLAAYAHAKKAALLAAFFLGTVVGASLFSLIR